MKTRQWPRPSNEEKAKFYSLTERVGDCTLWTGRLLLGYGVFKWGDRQWGAHRLVLVWNSSGLEPLEMFALHGCRNRNCVGLNHLRFGTPKENTADSFKDGTFRFGSRTATSVIKEKDVEEIWNAYYYGLESLKHLERKYKVGETQIGRILKRKSWIRVTANFLIPEDFELRKAEKRRIKLSDDDVRKVFTLFHEKNVSASNLSKNFNVCTSYIQSIASQKNRSDATASLKGIIKPISRPKYMIQAEQVAARKAARIAARLALPTKKKRKPKLSHDDVAEIFRLYDQGDQSNQSIADKFRISRSYVSALILGQRGPAKGFVKQSGRALGHRWFQAKGDGDLPDASQNE